MLEQAARCLDPRAHIRWSFSTTIRRPQQTLRSRRHLHNTFWHHGASDLDLPTYCYETFRNLFEPLHISPLTSLHWIDGKDGHVSSRSHDVVEQESFFVGLIIQRETQALVKKWSSKGKRYCKNHISNARREQDHRMFTSMGTTLSPRGGQFGSRIAIADDPSEDTATEEANSELDDTDTTQEAPGSSIGSKPLNLSQRVGQLLRNEDERPVVEVADELWEAFELMTDKSRQAKFKKEMVLFLAESERISDAHRIARVFGTIPVTDQDHGVMSAATLALIKINKIDEAHTVHDALYDHTLLGEPSFAATEALLVRDVQTRDWSRALQVWQACRTFHISKLAPGQISVALNQCKTKLSMSLSQLPDVLESTKSFLAFIVDNDQLRDHLAARPLCQALMSALFYTGAQGSHELSDLRILVEGAQALHLLRPAFYRHACEFYRTGPLRNRLEEALRLYWQFRKDADFIPPRFAIENLAHLTVGAQSIESLDLLEGDWRKFHGVPSKYLAVALMRWYAPKGMVAKIDDIINECTKDRTPPPMGFFYPVVRAEALRYGPTAVRRRFGLIRDRFNLSPDLTCWNLLLHAFGRHNDLDGALEAVTRLIEAGHRPDNYTIGTILGICAQRGGVDIAKAYLQYAVDNGLQINQAMYESVVLAYVNAYDYARALRLAEEVTPHTPNAATRMWTQIMANLAVRGRYKRALRVSRRMREIGVPFDGPAYAALMRIFTAKNRPEVALHIMSSLMRTDRVHRSQLHFAILIDGYAKVGKYETALRAYARMLNDGLSPDLNVRLAVFKVQGFAEKHRVKLNPDIGSNNQHHTSEELLAELLKQDQTQDLITKGPRMLQHQLPPAQASLASYFDALFSLYDREKAIEKVAVMLDHYDKLQAKLSGGEVSDRPIRFLYSLMRARQNEEDYESLDHLWQLSMQSGARRARTYRKKTATKDQPSSSLSEIDFENFEINETVPSKHQHLISRHLDVYLESLAARKQFSTIVSTIASVSEAGFQLDNGNWNKYSQILCQHGFFTEAFELVEQALMPRWRGFSNRLFAKVKQGHMQAQYLTFAHLRRILADLGDVRSGGEPNVVPIASEEDPAKSASEISIEQRKDKLDTDNDEVVTPSTKGVKDELQDVLADFDTSADSLNDDLEDEGFSMRPALVENAAERVELLQQILQQAPQAVNAARRLPRATLGPARKIMGEAATARTIEPDRTHMDAQSPSFKDLTYVNPLTKFVARDAQRAKPKKRLALAAENEAFITAESEREWWEKSSSAPGT